MARNIEKQQEILDFINSATKKNGYPPTVREICSAVGLSSPSTVHGYIDRMVKSGQLKKSPLKNRAICLAESESDKTIMHDEFLTVPVLGKVTAGAPILAVENIERTFPLPLDFAKNEEIFMLRVSGESMINKGILDGDYVIVTKRQTAQNGDIVVALIEDEATVKTFYKEKNYFRLQPENDYMEPIIVTDVAILGKVVGVFRKF